MVGVDLERKRTPLPVFLHHYVPSDISPSGCLIHQVKSYVQLCLTSPNSGILLCYTDQLETGPELIKATNTKPLCAMSQQITSHQTGGLSNFLSVSVTYSATQLTETTI